MKAPKGFERFDNWIIPVNTTVSGLSDSAKALKFSEKWNASQVMIGDAYVVDGESKTFDDIFTIDSGHWQINTLNKTAGTLYLKLQGLDVDSDIINGLVSYDNTAKTIAITDGNSFTMPAEDVSLLAISWDVFNIRIAVCGEVNYIIQGDVFENLTVAINSNVVSKLKAYAYMPRKLDIKELRELTETKYIPTDNGDIYLKPNGVTIAAYPETSAGWYRFDARDGFGEVDVLVIDTFANLSSIIREYPDDLGDGTNNMNEFVAITWGGVTKSIALNHVVTSKMTHFNSSDNTLGFRGINVNQNVLSWDASNVTNMRYMLSITAFNQDISSWNVSNVTNMYATFYNSQFNQDISSWDVSSVTDMRSIFYSSQFNQDISSWNVSNVMDMANMFYNSPFSQDISQWDVSNVTIMSHMFRGSPFSQDISSWCVEKIQTEPANFALNSPIESLPDFHPKWGEPCITCGDGSKHHEDYICGV